MEFIIVALAACAVFIFCFAVFLFKGRKQDAPRLHTCGQGNDCRCHGSGSSGRPPTGNAPGAGCAVRRTNR